MPTPAPTRLDRADYEQIIHTLKTTVPAEGPTWTGSVCNGLNVELSRSQWHALHKARNRARTAKRKAARA